MNFASNMAVLNQVPVGVFSMEMSFQEVVNRLFANVTDISLQRFRDGMLTHEDSKDLKQFREAFASGAGFENVPERMRKIIFAPLWIDDSPALSISSFKARARLMRTRYGVRAIVVDYLQLMHSPSKRSQEARWLEITEISASLKATAKELEIPIICCAQLNREAEIARVWETEAQRSARERIDRAGCRYCAAFCGGRRGIYSTRKMKG